MKTKQFVLYAAVTNQVINFLDILLKNRILPLTLFRILRVYTITSNTSALTLQDTWHFRNLTQNLITFQIVYSIGCSQPSFTNSWSTPKNTQQISKIQTMWPTKLIMTARRNGNILKKVYTIRNLNMLEEVNAQVVFPTLTIQTMTQMTKIAGKNEWKLVKN